MEPQAEYTPAGTLGASEEALREGQRLHPMTLVQRVLISLPALFFALLPVWRSPGAETWVSLMLLLAYGIVALPLILLQYLRFRYWVTPKEIVIRSGVVTRQHRSIPIDRIQNIEVEQSLLPRLLGTAKVKIVTAGSTGAEGVLEYVSLDESETLRAAVRAYQRRQHTPPPDAEPAGAPPAPSLGDASLEPPPVEAASAEPHREVLLAMPIQRVLLSGVFRFSLLYIALIFSALQYLDTGDLEDVADWLMTQENLGPIATWATTSPFVAGFVTVLFAAFLSWVTGIVINLNKYYGFRLWKEDDKLHKRSGLLTVSEGTIPLQKVQALILRTNPLMQRFGWYALELQTMGLDVEQRGYQAAAPFARLEEVLAIGREIVPFGLPGRFRRVSKLHIRRLFIRYTVLLALVAGPLSFFWQPALWAFTSVPLLLGLAYLRWRYHGFAATDRFFFVRRGIVRRLVWIVPVEKFQVLYGSASLFQRRLGLKSIYVDTAGAGGLTYPVVQDVPAATGDALLTYLYDHFRGRYDPASPVPEDAPDAAPGGYPPA